jgi:hypothetical protein
VTASVHEDAAGPGRYDTFLLMGENPGLLAAREHAAVLLAILTCGG